MIYQQPLAYLLGIEGVALLRAYAGDYDRDFTAARIAEVRRLLDTSALEDGVVAFPAGSVNGYRSWSATYDDERNGLFDHDEPVLHEILRTLPAGDALDAACGTGRYSEYLAAQGHRVIGVDSSPDMLRRARARVPQAEFKIGELADLPLPDDHVDIVVCALALCHLAELGPAFAEFARVLRPGGHLLISDVHHDLIALGSVPKMRSSDDEPGLLPAYRHRPADYLGAALPLGLQVRRCEEPRSPNTNIDSTMTMPADIAIDAWDVWPWSLLENVPAAARAAFGVPATILWHFQLPAR
jgi:SAM-dependent methyltransferase